MSVHLVVHAWIDRDVTAVNAALAVESLHINRLRDVGMGWLGTETKRVVDHNRKQVHTQTSLFADEPA